MLYQDFLNAVAAEVAHATVELYLCNAIDFGDDTPPRYAGIQALVKAQPDYAKALRRRLRESDSPALPFARRAKRFTELPRVWGLGANPARVAWLRGGAPRLPAY